MKKNNLKITNMVMTGKIPFRRKLKTEEMNKLITRLNWIVINEESSPILQKKILRESYGRKLSVHHKRKGMLLCLWSSGAVNIVGITNKKEGNYCYDLIVKDLKKISKTLLE